MTTPSFDSSINRSVASRFRSGSTLCGAVAMAIGGTALIGWILGDESLKGLINGINIKTNTAIGLLSTGLALVLLGPMERPSPFRSILGRLLGALAALIGLATLSQHLFGWDLGIDQLLFVETAKMAATQSPNRMGPPASVCFPLLGLALVLLGRRTRKGVLPSQPLALTAMAIASVSILGYVFKVTELYGIARYTGIALNTAIAFFLVGLGILFARPEAGPMRILVSNDSGGMIIRRLLPTAILLPIALALLRLLGEQLGWFDAQFGGTLIILSFIVAFSALTWWTSVVISRHEQARVYAEQAERGLKEQLVRSLNSERAAREQSEHANRMKDEFLATLSHELRTPLQAILGWAVVLQRDDMDPSEARVGLETIHRNAQLQAQLIEDLLDMSRIVSGNVRLEMRDVSLPQVAEAALADAAPSAEAKKIQIERYMDTRAPLVRGDPARLQQVLWNLITNAIKFTPTGGRVSVALVGHADHVDLSVTDTGVGIPPEMLEHVFERFRQADSSTTRRHGGLGLGLSIARQLTELHGGTLHARSDGDGRGSTFTVRLPVASRASAGSSDGARPIETVEGPASLEGIRVLVVEDRADTRDFIKLVLTNEKAAVTTAENSAEALSLLETDEFDVIVSDIGLPDRDGHELMRTIRSRGGTLPAIALTAFARSEDKELALAAGYQIHLAKPVNPSTLFQAISRLVERKPART